MHLLFGHDARFYYDDENKEVRSLGSFPSSVWERYLAHFGRITVLARQALEYDSTYVRQCCSLSSLPGVAFQFFPDLSSPLRQVRYRRETLRRISSAVAESHAVIARLPSEIGLLVAWEALTEGKPCAVELVGCPWDGLWNYGTLRGKLYAPVMAMRTRRVVAKAPFVLYVTREFLQYRYPNRHGLTVACSNVEIPSPSEGVLETRIARIQRQESPLVLGLIGSLNGRFKGIQTVFEALARVRKKLPPVTFRILGSGDPTPWQAEASQYGVEDLAVFDGTLPAGEPVFEWLDGVDIYLQPSFREGLPRALIEAMSRGCPALASTCAGIPELLEDECLIRPGDADALAEKLVTAANSSQWRKRQAYRNWNEASSYARNRLETRRRAFWGQFAEYASSQKRVEDKLGSSLLF